MADQLHVPRSPAGSESGSPRPRRPRHWTVQGPISVIAQQAPSPPAARDRQRPAATSRGDRAQRDRAARREFHRRQLGRRPAGDRLRRRDVAQRPRPSPSRAPQRPTIRRWIRAARSASISCLTTAQASASQGHGRPRGRKSGTAPDQRPEQRVAAEAALELAEVVVDAEREAHPLDRQLELRPAARRRRARAAIGGAGQRPGSSASARSATRSRAGCQAWTRTGLPSTWSSRVATPPRTRSIRSSLPCAAAGTATAAAPRPRRAASAGQRPSR